MSGGGASARPATLLARDVSIPRVHCGDPGGAARGWPLRPDASGRLLFLPRIHPAEPERDTSRCSFLCVSVCVCALCYINLIVTRWETLVRKKACARCLSPSILMLKSFFSLALCVRLWQPTEKLCDVFSVSWVFWPLFYSVARDFSPAKVKSMLCLIFRSFVVHLPPQLIKETQISSQKLWAQISAYLSLL